MAPTGEVRWTRLGTARAPSISHGYGVFDVAGFNGGYVLVDGSRGLKLSSDGVVWRTVRPGIPRGNVLTIQSVAANGGSVLVGGSYTPCSRAAYENNPFWECRARPASWVSQDGTTWRSSGAWTAYIGPKGKAGSDFVALWDVPSGGWDAAQLYSGSDESDDLEPSGPSIWHSNNGLTWKMRSPREAFGAWSCWVDTEGSWRFVADVTGRRVTSVSCYGDDEEGTDGLSLASSADGGTWTRVEGFAPVAGAWVRAIVAPGEEGRWVVVGAVSSDSVSLQPALAWSSPDLVTWTTTQLPVPAGATEARVNALTRSAGGLVAAGVADGQTITWLSADGVAWRLADAASVADRTIDDFADGPAGLLAFGMVADSGSDERYHLDVWRLDRP